jgi:hypothetical protein
MVSFQMRLIHVACQHFPVATVGRAYALQVALPFELLNLFEYRPFTNAQAVAQLLGRQLGVRCEQRQNLIFLFW